MVIKRLVLENFRSFKRLDLDLDTHFHVISGPNGSGKTTILEALYFCAYAKSFRTHQIKHFLPQKGVHLDIQAEIIDHAATANIYKYQYLPGGKSHLTLNAEKTKTTETAKLTPCIHIDTNTHRLLASQSKWRRDFLNFCAFYTVPSYAHDMAYYQKVLIQRNQLLKQRTTYDSTLFQVWDTQLAEYGERITQARIDCLERLQKLLDAKAPLLMQDLEPPMVRYHSAYGSHATLAEALEASRSQDLAMGYTHYGPHRGDLACRTESHSCILPIYSQGQLKRLAYTLKLAQLALVHTYSQETPLLLLDDLSAELDATGQSQIIQYMHKIKAQSIVTSIDASWAINQHTVTPLEQIPSVLSSA